MKPSDNEYHPLSLSYTYISTGAMVITASSISVVPAYSLVVPANTAVVLALLGDHTFGWVGGCRNGDGKDDCEIYTNGGDCVGVLELWVCSSIGVIGELRL